MKEYKVETQDLLNMLAMNNLITLLSESDKDEFNSVILAKQYSFNDPKIEETFDQLLEYITRIQGTTTQEGLFLERLLNQSVNMIE